MSDHITGFLTDEFKSDIEKVRELRDLLIEVTDLAAKASAYMSRVTDAVSILHEATDKLSD